jgi:hypothetical protein
VPVTVNESQIDPATLSLYLSGKTYVEQVFQVWWVFKRGIQLCLRTDGKFSLITMALAWVLKDDLGNQDRGTVWEWETVLRWGDNLRQDFFRCERNSGKQKHRKDRIVPGSTGNTRNGWMVQRNMNMFYMNKRISLVNIIKCMFWIVAERVIWRGARVDSGKSIKKWLKNRW